MAGTTWGEVHSPLSPGPSPITSHTARHWLTIPKLGLSCPLGEPVLPTADLVGTWGQHI